MTGVRAAGCCVASPWHVNWAHAAARSVVDVLVGMVVAGPHGGVGGGGEPHFLLIYRATKFVTIAVFGV